MAQLPPIYASDRWAPKPINEDYFTKHQDVKEDIYINASVTKHSLLLTKLKNDPMWLYENKTSKFEKWVKKQTQ